MPATRSRMSVSSSTISISSAMRSLGYRHLSLFRLDKLSLAGGGELHAHPSAALSRNPIGGIAQLDDAAMVLDNSPDYGQAQAGALFPRRDIGLEQPVAVFLWQADAIVDHVDDNIVTVTGGVDADRAFAEFGRRHGRNRFGGVLDDVGECLRQQP